MGAKLKFDKPAPDICCVYLGKDRHERAKQKANELGYMNFSRMLSALLDIQLEIPESLLAECEREAKSRGMTVSRFVQDAIRKSLSDKDLGMFM